MSRVIHFEIPADEPKRAVRFYRNVFGWKIDKWGPMEYWLASTGERDEPGIDGAIMRRPDDKGVRNTISVSCLNESIEKVKDEGGKIVSPKRAIPGVGWFVYAEDTEGNIIGMMQEDKNAK
jgi:predicted enzyme related to lactoylglutathione lyase